MEAGTGEDGGAHGITDAMQLLLLYLQLGEAVSELYLIDPMSPMELLCGDWIGWRALGELNVYIDRIVAAIPKDSESAGSCDKLRIAAQRCYY